MAPSGPKSSLSKEEHDELLGKYGSLDSSEELPLYTPYTSKRLGDPNKWKRRLFTLAVGVFLCVCLQTIHRDLPRRTPSFIRNPAYLISAKHGAVASENGRCSQIGIEVMKDGGNAIDATISTAFCIGVVNMFS